MNRFLSEVLEQIKSREAKDFVYRELTSHLQKSKTELMAKGMNEDEAIEKAVLQMGSSTELGQQFNKLHRPKIDWMLLGLFAAALIMGFLPLLTIQELYAENYLLKQALSIGIGAALAAAMMFFDYRKLERFKWSFLGAGTVILLALHYFPTALINGVPYIVLIFGISISGISALPFMFLFWASYLSSERPNLWLGGIIYLMTVFLFMSLPSLPVVMIYSLLVLILFWGSAVNRKTIYITTAASAALTTGYILLFWFMGASYQKDRILGFLFPEKDPQGAGFLYLKVRELLAGGGWFGNATEAKMVPDMMTDFAFANIAYHYGWAIAGILVLVLSLILFRILVISGQIKDRYGRQLVWGVIALFSIQFLYNVGMTLGFLPFISISLPFISYGFTSAVLNSFIIGIALSVYRRKNFYPVR